MRLSWKRICADPVVAALPYKVESDQWGNIVMSPPPGYYHSSYQGQIVTLLGQLLTGGRAMPEFPLQTTKGVKGVDVVWMSRERQRQRPKRRDLSLIAPEICVEVISPSNKRAEIAEKRSLYFEKGAAECWTCDQRGKMTFYDVTGQVIPRSKLCPEFPTRLEED